MNRRRLSLLLMCLVLWLAGPVLGQEPQAPDQAELEATAQRLFANDQLAAAGRLYEELAARSTTPAERGRALALAAWIASLAADGPRVEALLDRLVREAPGYEPDPSQFDDTFLAAVRAAREEAGSERGSRVAALVEEANGLARRGDQPAAAAVLDQALAIDPTAPAVLLHRARLASRLGDVSLSLDLLARLEEIVVDPARSGGRPSLADVHAERGLSYYRAGEFAQATGSFEAAAALEPQQAATWINMALARERLGDLEGAETAHRRVVALGAAKTSTWRALAAIAAGRGDWAAARDLLETAVAENAEAVELPALLFDIARAERALGRLDDARTRLERVVSLLTARDAAAAPDTPGLAAVRRELAFVLLESGSAAAALEEAAAAASADPGDADAHVAHGRALLELGRAPDAVVALQRAHRMRPERADIANSLGRALHLAGDHEAAAAVFEHALRIDPELTAARENLALARQAMGRAAAAQDAARAAAIFPGLVLRDATWPGGGRRAAEIVEVARDSAAAIAGLRAGDLVLRLDGSALTSAAALDAALRQARPGQIVRLDLIRGTSPFAVELHR